MSNRHIKYVKRPYQVYQTVISYILKNETIHIENLSIGYPGKSDVKVVADGICAGINSGELTCLLGANGVGKSTLLRTLSGFSSPNWVERYVSKEKRLNPIPTSNCRALSA